MTKGTLLRRALVVYGILLAIYLATSNRRLLQQSIAPHFVYQADALLHGRLALESRPPNFEDWALVETLTLRDGRQVRGHFLSGSSGTFRTLDHQTLTLARTDIAARKESWYVSFPPFPALLMMPIVALAGLRTNDVLVTALLAPVAPALLLLLLGHLRRRGLSARSEVDDLWLTALFAVGSVYFYSSLSGGVWYTAHIVAAALSVGYFFCAIEARHPAAAGLLLGLAFATRTPLLFLFPIFLLEAWRCRRDALLPVLVRFAAPAGAVCLALAAFNWARFGSPFEFGHALLAVRWAPRIERWGLFNYHFLSRNLAAAFTLLPRFVSHPPYVLTSRHGLSLFVTTPALLLLLWPRERPPLHRALWLSVLPVALLSFLYQNDGWIQFGYRFSLDYMVPLVLLLAIGGRPLGRPFRTLILIGIAVNLFGALTFQQASGRFFYEGFFPAD